MMVSRRDVLVTTGAAALCVVGQVPAFAQQFPVRGILVIVPYAAGGGSDVSARLLARDLEPLLSQSVTVENRAGGGCWIGWGSLAASKPDGYTIGYINAPSMFAGYLDRSQGGARKESLESFTPLINHVFGQCDPTVSSKPSRTSSTTPNAAPGRLRSTAAATAQTITSPHSALVPTPERVSRWSISAARRKARPRCSPAISKCLPAT